MLGLSATRSVPRVFQACTRRTFVATNLRSNVTPPLNEDSTQQSTSEEKLFQDLQKELDSIAEAEVGPALEQPQDIAQSGNELFGVSSFSSITANGRLDPKILPLHLPPDAVIGQLTEEQYAASLVHGRGTSRPFFHPRTHDVPVANIQFRSHHPRLLDLFTHFATHAAYSLGIPVSKPYFLPTQKTLWTVLRGPFAHKKSQENFQRKIHKRGIKAWDADPEVVRRWVQYLRKHALGGVGMRVTTWERLSLGVGASRLNDVDSFLQGRPEGSGSAVERSQRIKTMGEKIIRDEAGEIKASITDGAKS